MYLRTMSLEDEDFGSCMNFIENRGCMWVGGSSTVSGNAWWESARGLLMSGGEVMLHTN